MSARTGSVRMPDFAGVALVDILANGVAMLIIFIVLSVATQIDRDQRFAERAEEVASVMSHKFSTSLVLNSLAASPPARLHDYDNSPLDQIFDPEILPILELHKGFVREFYSGTIWTRDALLDAGNPFGRWVVGLNDFQRQRLRTDVYDVDQFYVAMAILREFGVTVNHWHFVPSRFALADARRCPPGVAAKDCASGAAGEVRQALPEMAGGSGQERGQGRERGSGGDNGGGGGEWPPTGSGDGAGGGGGEAPGSMPEGTTPGRGGDLAGGGNAGGQGGRGSSSGSSGGSGSGSRGSGSGGGGPPGGARDGELGHGFGSEAGSGSDVGFGSFPSANPGQGGAQGGLGNPMQRGQGSNQPSQVRFRMALPESLREELGESMNFSEIGDGSLEPIFGVLLFILGEFQGILDAGGSPGSQIAGFARMFTGALRSSLPLEDAEREIARDLAEDFARMYRFGGPDSRYDPLAVYTEPPELGESAVMLLETNRLIHRIGVARRGVSDNADAAAQFAQPTLNFNAHPDIWQGLNIPISLDSVVLAPPEAQEPERLRWRAVAYVAPTLDDFIVGFVHARVDDEGRLRIQGDANQVRIGGRPLFAETRESWFGARGWLVSLYAMLAIGLLLVLLVRRKPAQDGPSTGSRIEI